MQNEIKEQKHEPVNNVIRYTLTKTGIDELLSFRNSHIF